MTAPARWRPSKRDTLGGFNAFLSDQKALPGAATFTLNQFDNEFETVYDAVPLQDVPPLTPATFQPRGTTALLDAIGRTINMTGARLAAMPEAARPGKVLLAIMTDGQENASREFTHQTVSGMISHQREVYQWQIAFIGANQDAIGTAASIGVPASNALNYAATGDGTQAAIRSLSASTARYRAAPASPAAGFFTPDEGSQE